MANRAEVLENLKQAAKQGNIREAYRDFEELPFVDQLAISVSPGIGDALAAFEVGEFSARGAKNIEDKDFLGATGNYALAGLSFASLYPLLRLFRGAKAVKAIDPIDITPPKVEPKLLENLEPKELPVPKVEEFKPLSLGEMMYTGTKVKNQGLTSKAAKFINTSKKLPNQAKLVTYINELKKAGVPKGELRLLNIIDEADEIHPKLFDEIQSKNPLEKITRQRLANYIKAEQQGAISKRLVRKNQHARQIKELGDEFKNIKENTFNVRGVERKQYDHYQEKPHKEHFVFDSTSEFKLSDVPELKDVKEFIGGDNLLNVARIQSDYGEEVGQLAKSNSESQVYAIYQNDKMNLIDNRMAGDLKEFIVKVARENPQLKTADELKDKAKKEIEKINKELPASRQDRRNLDGIERDIQNAEGVNPFEVIQSAVKEAQKDVPVTPYLDGKKIAALKKGLEAYNDALPEINELSLKQADLQKKIESSELTPDSPSLANLNEEVDEIIEKRDALVGKNVAPYVDEFSGFTLKKEALEDITGKPFTESLDKTLNEIFYEIEELKTGEIGPIIQKYGPGSPEDRALRYFNEVVNNDKMTFDIGNGINILKKATKVKTDKLKGYPIDPYAKNTRTNYTKLPLRANFLKAVEEGKDGMYFDSAAKRLGKEGGEDNKLLQGVFKEGENEIDRMLKELGVDPKDYVLKPKDIEFKGPRNKFDGTYVKIDDEIRKLVKEKGIDAFKDGGAVEDDLPDVGSITPIGPYTKPLKPDLTFGDPVINKLKKAFNFLGDVKEFILPTPKVTDPLSLVDYVTSSSAPVVAGKTTVKGLGKIDLDAEDLEEFVEWVKSSRNKFQKERVADILKRDTKGPGKDIKNVTQNYLKENNLVDKNGNVHLYRYLNIAESNKLKPDEGLSSLTLNPEHAKMMAYKQANVTGRKLKEGEKGSLFDDMDPTSASKYEAVTMYRKPVVLEYQVPAEKIDAYLPAVFNSIDESGAGFNNLARMNVENSYSHLIDDLVDEGYDFYDATDELKGQYGLDDIYDSFDMANKESEALVDLTNIKPKNIYMDNLEIEQISNNPLIEKLEFYAGGPVSIDNMLAAL